MTNENRFIFSNHFVNSKGTFVAYLDSNIFTQEKLLHSLSQRLNFPNYFGLNWNALFDCLKDFHWIPETSIVLVHKELPRVNECDLKIYLEILSDAVDHWKSVDSHKFEVVFSSTDQRTVMRLMNSAVGAVG